jgi:hypothetical protein
VSLELSGSQGIVGGPPIFASANFLRPSQVYSVTGTRVRVVVEIFSLHEISSVTNQLLFLVCLSIRVSAHLLWVIVKQSVGCRKLISRDRHEKALGYSFPKRL